MSEWQEEVGAEANKAAAGWYGPGGAIVGSLGLPFVNMLMPAEADKGNLNEQYVSSQDIYDGKHKLANRNLPVGKLDSEESRLKLLNQLTQNEPKDVDGDGDARCGSTVLIAAAIQGGGMEGLNAIIDQMKKDGFNPDDPSSAKAMKDVEALAKKAKAGQLNMGDLDKLNGHLYSSLRYQQEQQFRNPDGTMPDIPPMGVDPTVLEKFIGRNETMTGYFKDGQMSIDSVDQDGVTPEGAENGGDHYVLQMQKRGANFIYDPAARKDKNQLIFNPLEQMSYNKREIDADQIDGADFGGTPFEGQYD